MKTYRARYIHTYIYTFTWQNILIVGKWNIIPGTSTVTEGLIVVDDQSRQQTGRQRAVSWMICDQYEFPIGEVPSHRPVLQGVCVVTGVRRAVPQDLPVVVEVESSYYYYISSYFTYSFFVGRGTGHRDGDQSVNASTRVREEARNWSKIRGYELLEPLVNGEDRTCEERIHRCSSIRIN